MENLNIEEFNPKKVELIELADSCKDLVIKGVDDINGYGLVNAKRKELKNARVQITKIGKSLRDNAIKFQKEVIAREKEFVGIVAPVEKKLEDMINDIDLEKEKIKRAELLPERKEKLSKVGVELSKELDDEILLMDDITFHTFLNYKTTEFLAEKERLLEEQRLKDEEEKAKREAEKAEIERELKLKKEAEEKEAQRLKELEEAKERATKLAILKAEKEKDEAILKEKQEKEEAIRAEKEASLKREQAIRDEQEARERARIQRELEEKMAKEKAEAEERARQEAIDKDKKWKEFLAKSGWTKEKENDFYILQNGNTRIIYKKVGEITI